MNKLWSLFQRREWNLPQSIVLTQQQKHIEKHSGKVKNTKREEILETTDTSTRVQLSNGLQLTNETM